MSIGERSLQKFSLSLSLSLALLLFSNAAHSHSCAETLETFSVQGQVRPFDVKLSARVLESIESDAKAETLIGRRVEIHEILGFIGRQLPVHLQSGFIHKVSESLEGLNIETGNFSFKKINFSYRYRLIDYSVNRSRRATIRWSNRVIKDQDALYEVVDRAIDLLAESTFLPIRMTSLYRSSPRSFQGENIEAMKDKILLKLFVLNPHATLADPGPLAPLMYKIKSFLMAFLPLHFAEFRSVKLTSEHRRVYAEEGPQGLYDLLRRQYGLGLATKYWLTHLANIKVVLVALYAAFMTPQVLKTYDFIVKEQSIQIEEAQYKVGHRLLQTMRAPPEKLLVEIEGHLSELPAADRALIEQFLVDSRFEFEPLTRP